MLNKDLVLTIVMLLTIVACSFVGGLLIGKYTGEVQSEELINKLIKERDSMLGGYFNVTEAYPTIHTTTISEVLKGMGG